MKHADPRQTDSGERRLMLYCYEVARANLFDPFVLVPTRGKGVIIDSQVTRLSFRWFLRETLKDVMSFDWFCDEFNKDMDTIRREVAVIEREREKIRRGMQSGRIAYKAGAGPDCGGRKRTEFIYIPVKRMLLERLGKLLEQREDAA